MKSNMITQADKEYIIEGLQSMLSYYNIDNYELFLSGSHSKVGRKYPNAKSDIDIYIVTSKKPIKNGIWDNGHWSRAMSLLIGLRIHIFFVSPHYKDVIRKNLEELK